MTVERKIKFTDGTTLTKHFELSKKSADKLMKSKSVSGNFIGCLPYTRTFSVKESHRKIKSNRDLTLFEELAFANDLD